VNVIVTAVPATTATINVTSNVSTGWCINGSPCNTGTTKSYTVTPGASGSIYTLTADTQTGYTGPNITNNVTGVGSTVVLYPGDAGTFSISYTSIMVGDPGCPTCNGGGFDYSLTGPASVNVSKKSSGQIVLTATLINTPKQAVTFSVTGNPTGVQVLPSSCSPSSGPTCNSTVTINVDSSVANGIYLITIWGHPFNKTKTINLNVGVGGGGGGSGLLNVTCASSPTTSALVGTPVTWTANAQGGTAPYRFIWSGDSIPNNPPPTFNQNGSINQYNIVYTTTGTKNAHVEMTDSSASAQSAQCATSNILIKFNPTFQEK
jgi:hypothetical protein